ncbi:MAG: hypothetical protein HC853_13345 [Anaerolineae bacterium]|nr:hypothetical protein [Anaerolineae bacterium]
MDTSKFAWSVFMVYHTVRNSVQHVLVRLVMLVALIVALQLPLPSRRAVAQIDCASSKCYYIPIASLYYPPPIRIKKFNAGLGRSNQFLFRADLESIGQETVYSTSVVLRAFGLSNTLLATGTFFPVFSATLPGQNNFVADRLLVSYFDVVTTEIDIANFSLKGDATYVSQTVTFSPSLEVPGDRKIGTIFNDRPITITNIVVVSGSSCGLLRQDIPGPVKPHGNITFTLGGCGNFAPLVDAQAQLAP